MNKASNRIILLVDAQPERADIFCNELASLGFAFVKMSDINQLPAATVSIGAVGLIILSCGGLDLTHLKSQISLLRGMFSQPIFLGCFNDGELDTSFHTLKCDGFISYDCSPGLTALQLNHAIHQSATNSSLKSHISKFAEGDLIYQQIVEGMREGMLVVDNDDVIQYANPKFVELLGYSELELIGKIGYNILLDPGAKAKMILRNKDREAGISEDYELTMVTKSGAELIFEMMAVPVTNSRGIVIGSMSLCLDITEHKHSENKIKALLKEKELLLKEVHHRIKNNMGTMSGLLTLQAMAMDNKVAIDALEDARGRIISMMHIYDKLYRSEDFKRISVAEYVTDLINSLKSTFQGFSNAELEASFGYCVLDSTQLTSLGILLNELITNSFKYAFPNGRHGKISLKCSQNDDGLHILEYSDNGIGIPEHIQSQQRESFGMNLIEMMVKQLGGTMELKCHPGTHYRITY